MLRTLSLLFIAQAILPLLADPTGTKCPAAPGRSETCVCKTDKGIIDLTSLSNKDGTARFKGLQDPNDYSYSYNPCQPYSGDYDCSTVHVCQVSNTDPTQTFDIADPGTEQMWVDTDGTPYLFYTGPESREVKVFLQCDLGASTPTASTDGDSGVILHYVFYITGKQVCPGEGGSSGGKDVAGPIGLVIIFVIIPLGLATYFIIGAVLMKYKFNATGTDIIPNKAFWFSLPFLIKDGCLFTFGPIVGLIKGKVSERGGYESVG